MIYFISCNRVLDFLLFGGLVVWWFGGLVVWWSCQRQIHHQAETFLPICLQMS